MELPEWSGSETKRLHTHKPSIRKYSKRDMAYTRMERNHETAKTTCRNQNGHIAKKAKHYFGNMMRDTGAGWCGGIYAMSSTRCAHPGKLKNGYRNKHGQNQPETWNDIRTTRQTELKNDTPSRKPQKT